MATKFNSGMINKLYEYLKTKLGLRDYRRGWLKGDCPDCGKLDKFGVNLGLNRTNCFVCGYHPKPINLVMDVEGLENYREAYRFLNAYDGIEFYDYLPEVLEKKDIKIPPNFRLLNQGDSYVSNIIRSYVKNRGFNINKLSKKGFGYCDGGKYFGHFIIPYFVKSEFVYFNARRVIGGGPKFNNPDIEEFGVGKSLLIYNIDALSIYDTIYLAESALNAETMGENAIGIGGKKISFYQLSLIIRAAPLKEVIIILDPDAWNEAIELGLDLVFHKNVRLVKLPGDADINDIGKKEVLKFVNKSNLLSYNDILRLRHENTIASYR